MNESQGLRMIGFKASLVANGYSQSEDVEFNKVFSLVVRHSCIHVLLAMVAIFGLELEQLDMKNCFSTW
jgi:hypothetical protein